MVRISVVGLVLVAVLVTVAIYLSGPLPSVSLGERPEAERPRQNPDPLGTPAEQPPPTSRVVVRYEKAEDGEAIAGVIVEARARGETEYKRVGIPNCWGLYDMHGNVEEWCEDTFHETYWDAPTDGSLWTKGGRMIRGTPYRVVRGGDWKDSARSCRSAYRYRWSPTLLQAWLGFRPAFSNSDD